MLYNNLVGFAGNSLFFMGTIVFYPDSSKQLGVIFSDVQILKDVLLIAFCGAIG